MIGVGVNFANNLKAKNFLGTLSIRNGLFFIAIQQFLLGISLYSIIHYLHPSMTKLAWLMFSINAISAVLGFCGALKRNMVIELVYLVFYFISLLLAFMIVLDMAELVHLFPKAPELHNLVNLAAMKSGAYLRAGHMKPHSFIKEQEIPEELHRDLDGFEEEDDLDLDHDMTGHMDDVSDVSTDVEEALPLLEQDLMDHARTAKKRANSRLNVKNNRIHSGDIDRDYIDQGEATGRLKSPATTEVAGSAQRSLSDASRVDVPLSEAPVSETRDQVGGYINQVDRPKVENVGPRANQPAAKEQLPENGAEESFYDRIPFVPHLGEKEGEAEEVSKEELPPETRDLTPQGISEVVAIYKIQKRPLKMASAGLITVALLFNIYCYWVAVTFVLNKCTCLDELVSHPEQFTPLID